MRLHDMLMTETPRPLLADKPFTLYADLFGDSVVVDGTEVLDLTLAMTDFNDEQIGLDFRDFGGDEEAWQMAQFFAFDHTALSNITLPFQSMSIEFDVREAMERQLRRISPELTEKYLKKGGTVSVGKASMAMFMHKAEDFRRDYNSVAFRHSRDPHFHERQSMRALLDLPDLGYVIIALSFIYLPGRGMVGPEAHWYIPVRSDGAYYTLDDNGTTRLQAVVDGPATGPYDGEMDGARIAVAAGWRTLIPALMTINFMHTPQGDKGYHKRVAQEPLPRLAKKYLAKHFRPMSKWYVLDISPLREAVRSANGGVEPTNLAGFLKALHIVRGNYAHYAPNTYFGRQHDEWITVFRPAHRRGDKAAGVVDKDYHVEAS